jgi:signal peptidase I
VGSRTGFGDDRATAQPIAPKGILRDYAETILICVIFVVFTRAFIFQQSKIPSGSMEDTLLIGDYIMVNRYVYSPAETSWERALFPVRDVRRGDVIVFKFPEEPETDYIKRVVGIPGDVIELRSGSLYVNGQLVDEPYVQDSYRDRNCDPYQSGSGCFGPKTVEPGHYFCMGDHRNRSSDSRVWGFVPRDLIKGRALMIWWSYTEGPNDINLRGMDQLKAIGSKVAHLFTRSRWSRCFTIIH